MRALVCGLALVAGSCFASPEPLFDGESLDGWRVRGAPYWRVVGDTLIGQSDAGKKNSVLWTKESFGDFELSFEFRYAGDIDSGVFLRQENDQIQIGISRSLKRDMTASPYIGSKRGYPKEAKQAKDVLKPGDWNRMTIRAVGNVYVVHLNGIKVMDYSSETAKEEGPIGLQVHPGVVMKIEFRDVQIDRLDD
ncbi:3-keto-disaccharide hydrolase [Haloferula rosea]|uniref:DUF1080 domain-containing protein n=1 Tax=Haloferula rosea TaxID=490093 RepID=A0A934RBQ3_9BACT|nr:DUF1080 domain-containing protein [Haloferula rosea]MBK1826061.1 DUF1080 domain-containing protein [Haloferula rosea]